MRKINTNITAEKNTMILESTRRPSVYLIWMARLLTLVFAVFISIFALDVFEEKLGFLQTVLALLLHLVPTFFILLVLWLSWNRGWIGSIVFSILGILYIWWAWGRFELITYLLISGPLFLVSILFLLGWWEQQKEKSLQL